MKVVASLTQAWSSFLNSSQSGQRRSSTVVNHKLEPEAAAGAARVNFELAVSVINSPLLVMHSNTNSPAQQRRDSAANQQENHLVNSSSNASMSSTIGLIARNDENVEKSQYTTHKMSVVAILFVLNFINYMDRFTVAG